MCIRAAFGLILAIPFCGQDFRATLSGQVTDPTGAAVPAASVTATNVEGNVPVQVQSGADGHYTIPHLNPGIYNVDAKAPGFETLHRTGIVLRVADKVDLPIHLKMGQMTQQVTVTTAQDALETADASRGLVFDPLKTQQLPQGVAAADGEHGAAV